MADINSVHLTGRIGTDPELRATTAGVSVCRFRLAVERMKQKGSDEAEVDWLDIVTWRQQADFVDRYLGKGRKVAIEAAVRTRVWEDNDKNKRKSVEFHVTNIIPADSRPQNAGATGSGNRSGNNSSYGGNNNYSGYGDTGADRFMDIPDDEAAGLPFN